MSNSDPHIEALELLQWYGAMGVDAALDDAPTDWLAKEAAPPGQAFAWPHRTATTPEDAGPTPPTSGNMPSKTTVHSTASPATLARPRPQTPLGGNEADTGTRRIARAAATLSALETALRAFDGCSLKATAKNLCFYRGSAQARLMIIGEAPGREEDLEGKPFVGSAGQLLDKMLAAIGLTEAEVHITNVVYWRPPGNRTPTPQEALACRPFLDRQMELVNPDILVALGGSAAKEVFGVTEGIMRLRGKWREIAIGERAVPALATLHPAYLLRAPAAKQLVWLDLLQIKARLRDRG